MRFFDTEEFALLYLFRLVEDSQLVFPYPNLYHGWSLTIDETLLPFPFNRVKPL